MIRTRSGWQHQGMPCEARFYGKSSQKACRHVQECEKLVQETDERALVLSSSSAFEVEAFASDAQTGALVALESAAVDVVKDYCYSFNQGDGIVTDLSIKGVQAIAREMAKKGEIIKPVKIEVVAEDDEEIRILCTAVREIVRVQDGVVYRVELDQRIGAKRQPKMQEVNVWEGPQGQRRKAGTKLVPDKFWYEKAVSKATRNAMAPLLGLEARAQVISLFRQAKIMLGTQAQSLPPERSVRFLGPGNARTSSNARPAQQQQTPPPPTAQPKLPADETDAMDLTPALRQQITKKYNEGKTSFGGDDGVRFHRDLYATFPEIKPLQGAVGIILTKVKTIGRGKEIMSWLIRAVNGPEPDDESGGLEGAQSDPAAQQETTEAVLHAVCDHPDEDLTAHPTKEDTLVCGKCNEEIILAAADS